MKVLWLAPINHPKGNSHPAPWIEELAKYLSQKIDLTILNVSSTNEKKIEIYHDKNIKKIFLKSLRPKLEIITLYQNKINIIREWLKENHSNYDLIHIHGNEHQFEVAVKGLMMPKVLSVQGIISEILKYYKPEGWQYIGWNLSAYYERKYFNSIENYSCRTHWDKSIVKDRNNDAKIYHIWETIREEFFIDEYLNKGKNILFTGGLKEIKGIYTALKAFELIKDKIEIKFLLAGEATYSDTHHYIKKNKLNINIQRDIKLLGFLNANEIIECAKDSLCFLHPTLIDNSPNSICEAQIMGLPVIATNVGGVSSLIENNKTGILTNSDPNELSNKILMLYKNDFLWSSLSKNSRQISRIRHNSQVIIRKHLEMYHHITNK